MGQKILGVRKFPFGVVTTTGFLRLFSESWLSWTFLYLATVLLPVGLVGFVAFSAVRTAGENSAQGIRVRLIGEAQAYGRQLTRENAIMYYFWKVFVNQSPACLLDLERKVPGAFRWVIWNGEGKVLDLPPDIAMPGKVLWQEVVSGFMMKGQTTKNRLKAGLIGDPLLNKLQRFLGPQLSAVTFLDLADVLHRTTWVGNPCLVYWKRYFDEEITPPPAYLKNIPPSTQVAGFILFHFPSCLPNGFWDTMFLEGQFASELVPSGHLGLLDLDRPANFRLGSRPGRRPRMGNALYQALLHRTGETLTVGRWLAVPITGVEKTMRFVLLKDMAPLQRQTDHRKTWVFRMAGLALLLGTTLFVSLYQGWADSFSLVWKVSGLFVVAILLPIIGLLLSGSALLANEESHGKTALLAKFRECANSLRFLEKEFPDLVSRVLQRRLASMAVQSGSVPRFVAALQQEVKTRQISNFFLSDTAGNLAVCGDTPQTEQLKGPMKLMVREAFRQITAQSTAAPPMTGFLMDEFKNLIDDPAAMEHAASTRLRSFRFAKTEFFVMTRSITLSGEQRILIIVVNPSELQHGFVRREFLTNRFSRATTPGDWFRVEVSFLTNRSAFPNYPPESFIQKIPALAWSSPTTPDMEGVAEIDGETIAWYSPSADLDSTYRPVLWCSLAPLQKNIREQTQLLVGGGLFIIVVALILGLQLASRLLIPVWQLEEQVTEVGRGNLQVGMPPLGQDELGRLAGSFNEMIRGLRERERMRAYVSETVLEAVRDDATGEARRGIRKVATILFCDVRGFTTLSEVHGAEAMFLMLNGFLGVADQPIRDNGGRIDKFIGDAVMAVFLEDGPCQAFGAVRAALAMKDCLNVFNQSRRENGAFTIDIGIGINTGPVMLGDVGGERRKDLTVIGDAVNLAARLETVSKLGRHTHIVLSEETFRLVADHVAVEEMAVTEVKGKTQPIRVFELISYNPLV